MSIFRKIVDGEIPSHKIYEDDNVLAFMDIHPIQPGHVLVIPKKEVETFEQLDDELYMQVMTVVKRVASKIKQELKPKRVGVIIEGFDVPHAHIKVLPINSEAELRHLPNMDEEPDHDALAKMAERLRLE